MSTVGFTPDNNNRNNISNKLAEIYSLNNTFFEYSILNQNLITKTINSGICKIALGLQNCLYFNNLLIAQNSPTNNTKEINLLTQFLGQQKHQHLITNTHITLRQFISLTFAHLGIEVAYSGKNQYEKGVIIDVDEEVAKKLGLCLQTLKQGQTVVKLAPN